MSDPIRPDFDRTMSRDMFERWYWSKAQLEGICTVLDISRAGSKAELRERIAHYLEDPDAPPPRPARRHDDGINWAKTALSLDTIITPSITFGPNLRGFFKREIGRRFVCHGDFMDWVRSNDGATLRHAINAWHMLERRKDDPDFRREIAEHNNFLQYLRDFADALPERSLAEAKTCWDQKKVRPAVDGKVIFDASDVRFL
ncbi:MAG: DUF6434 domain-containing protein [Pseudomonadota bacterium]